MPDWSDCGLILNVRKHSEMDGIVTFLTQDHGKHNSLCKSVFSKRNSGTFQPGNLVQIAWNARLEEHLGLAKIELMTSYSAGVLTDSDRLSVLASTCALAQLLPERESNSDFFKSTIKLLAILPYEDFFEQYARWELDLLTALGFGLDLTKCAVTEQKTDLIYVSPKSGRAVSASAGFAWKNRLLDLPQFLLNSSEKARSAEEIKKALKLTGFFLENYVAKTVDYPIPIARSRLIERVKVSE